MIAFLAIVCLLQTVVITRLAWFAWRQFKGKRIMCELCFELLAYNETLLEELDVQDAVFIERANLMHERMLRQAEWN